MADNPESIRQRLTSAASDLLEGRVPGPLTSVRLVEVANVKRHRLTHDNPDVNAEFQRRAREINRTKPEVDSLRNHLDSERATNAELRQKLVEVTARNNDYAATIIGLLDERDRLQLALTGGASNVRQLPL